jgi:hemoglobin
MSIYDTIGGEEALVSVVDDFYRRVLVDPELANYFVGVNMNRLKGRQVAFFAQALGGPALYEGASMRDAHLGRGISQTAFDHVAAHLTDSLQAAGVPDELVTSIIGTIAPLAEDIVASGV